MNPFIESLKESTESMYGEFSEYYPESAAGRKFRTRKFYEGSCVDWVGRAGQMSRADSNYIFPEMNNLLEMEKLAAVRDGVLQFCDQGRSVVLVAAIGYASKIHEDDVEESQAYPGEKFPFELSVSDIGRWMVRLEDGHHRVFGAILAGESRVWINLQNSKEVKQEGGMVV